MNSDSQHWEALPWRHLLDIVTNVLKEVEYLSMMAVSRIVRPASRFISSTRSSPTLSNSALRPAASLPTYLNKRPYATPSGVKEVAVRDALNEALAEELESNSKVFVLGEEVAQYNGALVPPFLVELCMLKDRANYTLLIA